MGTTGRRDAAVVVLLMLGVGATGCRPPEAAPGELAEGCLVNTDCRDPLVCAFRRCHNACRTDRDCPKGLHCRGADRPLNVCLLDDELLCPGGRDRECPLDMVCGPDLVCREACRGNRDCLADQTCVQGLCANPAEVVDGGLPVNAEGVVRCVLNSDCSAPLVCRSGGCVRECRESRDCAPGAFCADAGVCAVADGTTIAVLPPGRADAGVLADGYGEVCVVNSDCRNRSLRCLGGRCGVECFEAVDCNAGLNQCCTPFNRCAGGPACIPPDAGLFDPPTPDGGCRNDADCQDTVRCNGAERCIDRRCRAAEKAFCDDGNPCSLDLCAESGPPCSYSSVITDVDGDGRIPAACGGSADDCDDFDRDTFPGAPERCDFKDNNCNGAVDEALWRVKPGSRGPLTAGGAYPPGAGKPAAVMHKGEIVVVAASDTVRGSIDAFTVDPTSLSVSSGPLPLGGSRTQWARCGATVGKRVVFPTLASNGTSLMATGYAQSWPGTTCCDGNAVDERDGFYTLFDTPLTVRDGGTLFRITGPSRCTFDSPIRQNNYALPPWVTADPASGDWAFAWVDSTQTGQVLPARVFAAILGTNTDGLSLPRHLWPSGTGDPAAEALPVPGTFEVVPSALAARSGQETLVAWYDNPNLLGSQRSVRFVLYDRRLRTARGPPLEVPVAAGTVNGYAISTLDALQGGFLIAVHQGFSVNFLELFWITSDAGVRARRRIQVSQSSLPNSAASAGLQPAIVMTDGGLLLAATDYGAVANASSLRFLWTTLGWDAGVQSLTLPLGQTVAQHSDFSLVAVTPRQAAAFWQDGDIQKVAFECMDP